MKFFTLFIFAAAVVCKTYASNNAVVTEKNVRQAIFEGYDKLVRPVLNARDNVVAAIGWSPLAITRVGENVLEMDSWLKMMWKDQYLTWDPLEFNNISLLRIPNTEVWKPDVALYTTAAESTLFPKTPTNVLVYSSGEVLWVPLLPIVSRCPMKAGQDILKCTVKIGSWTFDQPTLDIVLDKEGVDLSDFMDIHPDWRLKDVVAIREEKHYDCCVEAYPSISYNMTLIRRDRNINNNVINKYKVV